jgi:hypothetical protein
MMPLVPTEIKIQPPNQYDSTEDDYVKLKIQTCMQLGTDKPYQHNQGIDREYQQSSN